MVGGRKSHQMDVQVRYQLEDIMERQVEAMEKIRQSLRTVPMDILFNQIDFFNNGYVDASSLTQFIQHHAVQAVTKALLQPNVMELRCMEAIRYLKGSATGQKIFYADFPTILEDNDISQNPQQIPAIQNHSLSLSRSIGHIARVSELDAMHSRSKRLKNIDHPEQSNIHFANKSMGSNLHDNFHDVSLIRSKINLQEIDKIKKAMNQSHEGLTYQDKICANHWRNNKYMEKMKIQSNISHFKPSSQQIINSQQHIFIRKSKQTYKNSFNSEKQVSNNVLKPNSSQIIYQLRYIGQLYERHRKQVENFITENKSFSIINGFNVIDVQDKGSFSLKQLKQFLFQIDLKFTEDKVYNFFTSLLGEINNQTNIYSERQISFSKFAIKIFKIMAIQEIYRSCRKRKPLLSQQWPSEQKSNYCRFIRSVISIFSDISNSKKTLRRMLNIPEQNSAKVEKQKIQTNLKYKMEQIFHQNEVHYDKFKEVMGKNSQTMILQLYGQQTLLQPANFLDFLYSIK